MLDQNYGIISQVLQLSIIDKNQLASCVYLHMHLSIRSSISTWPVLAAESIIEKEKNDTLMPNPCVFYNKCQKSWHLHQFYIITTPFP